MTNLTPELLQSISVKCAAKFMSKQASLSKAVADEALTNELGPEQIKRVIETTNTIAYLSKEAIYASSTSEQSKESVKWTKLSMDLARIIKSWVMDSSEAKRDLEIAIANVVPEFAGLDSLLEENRKL